MEEENKNMARPKIIYYVGFNFDSEYFTVGSDIGFQIIKTSSFDIILSRILNGGIGLVKILDQTNIFCLVGGGKYPRFSPNKLMIWNDNKNDITNEFRCNSFIINCYIKKNCIIIICPDMITIINLKNMKIIHNINTINNPTGISSISNSPKKYIFAFPEKGNISLIFFNEFEKGNNEELKKLKKLEVNINIIKNAHKGSINTLCLNYDGSKLASASERGTIVRVFNSKDKNLIFEFRRGNTDAYIYCLNFSFDDSLLGLTSDHGTCHIFSLKKTSTNEKNKSKNSGYMSYLSNNLSFGGVGKKLSNALSLGQELSWKKFDIPHRERSFISFLANDNNNVYIIDKSGNYLSINLTSEQEPKIIKKKKIV